MGQIKNGVLKGFGHFTKIYRSSKKTQFLEGNFSGKFREKLKSGSMHRHLEEGAEFTSGFKHIYDYHWTNTEFLRKCEYQYYRRVFLSSMKDAG